MSNPKNGAAAAFVVLVWVTLLLLLVDRLYKNVDESNIRIKSVDEIIHGDH